MRNLSLVSDAAPECALVLLSGLDSTVALHWARESFAEVAAVSIWYGQPHAAAEIAAAQAIALRRRVPWTSIHVAEAVRGLAAITPPEPGLVRAGVSRANLPARNPILISVAGAHAARFWPSRRVAVIVGANVDDARGFPDCRAEFIESAGRMLSAALAGVADLWVRAPWIEQSFNKAAIVRWAAERADALADARLSVSCYRGTRCGACDACALRASAFASVGISDGTDGIAICGGDPQREAR